MRVTMVAILVVPAVEKYMSIQLKPYGKARLSKIPHRNRCIQ